MNTLVIAVFVVVVAVFYLGFLVGGEVQRHILRGHEGTRAEKLRELRRQRQAHVLQRRRELYGPMLRSVDDPDSDSSFGSRSAREDQARWWRRHPGPVRPDLPLPQDPFVDDSSSDTAL